MNADIKGALEQIDRSWSAFVHKGNRMSKNDVIKVLEYGKQKGYTNTGQLSDEEVDTVLSCKNIIGVFFIEEEPEIDDEEDEHFEPCDNCDLPDACADYGCAIKSGLRKPSMP